MNLQEIEQRKKAELVGTYLSPLKPRRVIVTPEVQFVEPILNNPAILTVDTFRQALDSALFHNATPLCDPAIRAKILYWDGVDGFVGGFWGGRLVSFGQVKWLSDQLNREKTNGFMSYHTAYIVASEFQNKGLGFSMMQLLEDHIACNTQGVGAAFFYKIVAQSPENQVAARRMIQKIGAIDSKTPGWYTRMAMQEKYYYPQDGITKISDEAAITAQLTAETTEFVSYHVK